MVLVVGRQGIAGSKVHPTEVRGELFFFVHGTFLGEQKIKGQVLKYFTYDTIYSGTTYQRCA